jgi:hypothetical protein
LLVKNYPVGILDGIRLDPATVSNGKTDLDPNEYEWEDLGGDEWILRRKDNRLPLPLVA